MQIACSATTTHRIMKEGRNFRFPQWAVGARDAVAFPSNFFFKIG